MSVVRGATVRTRLLSAGRRDDETTAGNDASESQRSARKAHEVGVGLATANGGDGLCLKCNVSS